MAEGSTKQNYEGHLVPDLDEWVGVAGVLGTIAFFTCVNAALPLLVPRMKSDWRCRNLAVSWVHALICAVGCLYCLFAYWEHVQSLYDLIEMKPYPSFMLIALSTGYFLYDFMDHAREGVMLQLWEVIMHHIAVILIFGYNLIYHRYIGYSIVALHTEVNSVFLHGRKLLQMFQVPFGHWLYRTVVVINLLTFVLFRGVPLTLIWVGIFTIGHTMSTVYAWLLSIVMVFMVLLNPVLFWRLLKSDVLRVFKKKHSQPNGGARPPRVEFEKSKTQNGGLIFFNDSVSEKEKSL